MKENIIQKSAFKVIEKEKTSRMFSFTENGRLLLPFPGSFHKISAENHCDWKQNRSEHKLAS